MDDLTFCLGIGIITFIIGLVSGYYVVASECRDKDSIEPLLDELERET